MKRLVIGCKKSFCTKKNLLFYLKSLEGGLAQLARALAWHARGRRFDPDTLHLMFLKFVKFIKFMAWSVSETETFH